MHFYFTKAEPFQLLEEMGHVSAGVSQQELQIRPNRCRIQRFKNLSPAFKGRSVKNIDFLIIMVNAFTRSSKIMPSVSYCSVWLGHRKNTRTIFYRHPNGRILLQISGLISRESFPDKTSCLLNARTIKMSENDAYLYVIRNRQLNQSLIKTKSFVSGEH